MELELEFGGIEIEIKGFKGLVTLVSLGLLAAALVQELMRPPDQRTWTGKAAGVVPYDFRKPTLDRIKERLWKPESGEIIVPRAFGLGWTLNFGAVAKRLRLVA